MPTWRPEAFLASLDPSNLSPVLTARLAGSAATSAGALYAAFIESPNFAFWFKQRRAPVLHLVEDEVGGWVGGRMQSVSLSGRQAACLHLQTRRSLYWSAKLLLLVFRATTSWNPNHRPVAVLLLGGGPIEMCCAVLCRAVRHAARERGRGRVLQGCAWRGLQLRRRGAE